MVPGGIYEPVIPVAPVSLRGHVKTKLHELKTVLDAGRGGWSAQIGASTVALAAEIGSALVVPNLDAHTRYTQGLHKQGK